MEGPEVVVKEKYDHDNITYHVWNNRDSTEYLRIGALHGWTNIEANCVEGKERVQKLTTFNKHHNFHL